MLLSLTRVISEQGRAAETEALARANVAMWSRSGAAEHTSFAAESRMVLGDALFAQGRWKDALVEYDDVKTALQADAEAYEKRIAGNLNYTFSLVRGERGAEALALIEPKFRRLLEALGEKHYNTAEANGAFAAALAATGDNARALKTFAAAIPILLQRSRRSEQSDTTRSAVELRLRLILEACIELLAEIRGSAIEADAGLNAAEEAFRIADVVRGQSVQKAIVASSARAAAHDRALAELARREQDALTRIGALNGLLSNLAAAPKDKVRPDLMKTLRERINQLREERAQLMADIEARFPDYSALVNPKPATVAEVREIMHEGEALIATYSGEKQTHVWAVPKSGPVAYATATLGSRAMRSHVRRLRRALDPQPISLDDIPAFDLKVAYQLYAELLEPVADGWRAASRLVVVSHGALGFLPLSLLPTAKVEIEPGAQPFAEYRQVPWLARTHAVTALPSVAALKSLRSLALTDATGEQPFVGFGDPIFGPDQLKPTDSETVAVLTTRGMPLAMRAAPSSVDADRMHLGMLPRLPDTEHELKEIAGALRVDPGSSLFLGRQANEKRRPRHGSVERASARLRHPRTGARRRRRPDSTRAGDDGRPKLPASTETGLLTLGEILGLRLNADWVVLSACNTGAGDGAGAEALSGLGRAFFYAGTRALLVSNWPVETNSARALTTDLFRRQAADPTLPRARALNEAMHALIDGPGFTDDGGQTLFSYAHPLFWAPFSLVGDGG